MRKVVKSIMANIKSSEKRAEIDIRNRTRNRARVSKLKNVLKNALAALGTETEKDSVNKAIKVIDKTLQQGTIHKNKAARLKSRLVAKLSK